MRPEEADAKFRDYMRLRHLALSTEQSYRAWLARFMRFLAANPMPATASEAKVEAFLSGLARHASATHSLNRGINPRAIQQAMGHVSLETTMGYLHAEALSVPSPLEAIAP
jgi:site-specific recombinase XerD